MTSLSNPTLFSFEQDLFPIKDDSSFTIQIGDPQFSTTKCPSSFINWSKVWLIENQKLFRINQHIVFTYFIMSDSDFNKYESTGEMRF